MVLPGRNGRRMARGAVHGEAGEGREGIIADAEQEKGEGTVLCFLLLFFYWNLS